MPPLPGQMGPGIPAGPMSPDPMGGAPTGLPPTPAPMMGVMDMIAQLATSRPQHQTAGAKVKKAVDFLRDAREQDPKQARLLSMAIHVLEKGPDSLDDFDEEEEPK